MIPKDSLKETKKVEPKHLVIIQKITFDLYQCGFFYYTYVFAIKHFRPIAGYMVSNNKIRYQMLSLSK